MKELPRAHQFTQIRMACGQEAKKSEVYSNGGQNTHDDGNEEDDGLFHS